MALSSKNIVTCIIPTFNPLNPDTPAPIIVCCQSWFKPLSCTCHLLSLTIVPSHDLRLDRLVQWLGCGISSLPDNVRLPHSGETPVWPHSYLLLPGRKERCCMYVYIVQQNSPETVIKLLQVGFEHSHTKRCSYQLSYWGSLAGWAKLYMYIHTNQSKQSNSTW